MAKKDSICYIQSVDSIFTFESESRTTGEKILEMILKYYQIYESRWFGLLQYDPECQHKRLDLLEKIRLKDIPTYPGTSIMFHLTMVLYPITSRFEIIQDSTRILLFKFELERSMNDHEYHILPEWRALLIVSFARLTAWEDPTRSAKSRIEKHFDKLVPEKVLNKYALTRTQMKEAVFELYEETIQMDWIELVQQSLEFLETSSIYGVKYFPIKHKQIDNILVGINSMGAFICLSTNKLNPLIVFKWKEIKHATLSKKKIKITPTKKDDRSLKFKAINVAQATIIFATLIENYQYSSKGNSLEEVPKFYSEKPRCTQELVITRRNAEIEIRITELNYRAYFDSILKGGSITGEEANILEEMFLKIMKLVEHEIVELSHQIDLEKSETNEDTNIKFQKLSIDEIATIFIDNDRKDTLCTLVEEEISLVESKMSQVEGLKSKLEQLSLFHSQNLEKLQMLSPATSTQSTNNILQIVETIPKLPSIESEFKRIEKIHLSVQKVAASVESKVGQDSQIKTLRMLNQSNVDKFKTLEKLRSTVNVGARIDMFESM